MRRIIQGLVLAIGIGFAGLSGASAAPVSADSAQGITVQGASVQKVYYGGYCERLRRACVYKHERGEEGMGNCRRYQHECGEDRDGYDRREYCRRLWHKCEYKYERGEEGQGNCRRAQAECGDRR